MKLAAGSWELALAPSLGGGITCLRRRGEDILRPAAGATEAIHLSCFPMVPYANRIAEGRFEAGGMQCRIPPNLVGHDHPLHGVGWLRPWIVAACDATSATLVHHHMAGEAWPWSYRAEQDFVLDERGLSVSLTLTNADNRTMPASLGFHPYFPAHKCGSLQFEAGHVWMRDDQLFPSRIAAADTLGDWQHGAPLRQAALIDNSYVEWTGSARISHADGEIVLTGENTPVLHLFLPPGEPFSCLEPATSIPDAVNRSTPITLHPGQRHRIAMSIRSA